MQEPTFADVRRYRPPTLRDRARAIALSALSAVAPRGKVAAALRRPRVQFLYLHHVFRDEEPAFRHLLRSLAADHAFLGHGEAIQRIRSGRIDRAYVSFSFDDGFADNMRAAAVLEEFGARGCFFVCPGVVGETDPARLRWFCASRLEFPVVSPLLGWRDLEALIARGHEIGGHTMTHPDLGTADPAVAISEIAASHARLTDRLGGVRHFAWPRGRWQNFTRHAKDAVFGAGYISCASAVRGCHVTMAGGGAADLCVRRDHVLANWPLSHIRYLLARNSDLSSAATNEWPPRFRAHPGSPESR